MLTLIVELIPERWDEKNQMFLEAKSVTLQLEHSLVSLRKWESKWHKPFLSKTEMSIEETLDYIRCMTLTKGVPDEVYDHLTQRDVDKIIDYIKDPMTATTFREDSVSPPNHEIVTAEIIYYWMIALGIPFECQKWHLNSLVTLIRVCNVKNQPPRKRSTQEIIESHRMINEKNKKLLNTKG